MKKIFQVVSIIILASLFFMGGCTFPFLIQKERTNDEISQLIRAAPAVDSYPDASALVIFDQDIIEVFPDGSYKATYHKVIKVLAERGKEQGNIRFGFNSSLQKVKILHAKTTTPDGKTMPLRKNAIKIVTPYSGYPEYSDYKQLTFSMPGVIVGSIIDYKLLLEGKASINGHYSNHPFFQTRSPILLSRHKVILPKNKELKYLALNPPKGIDPSPSINYESNRKVYLWEFRDIPQILYEGWLVPPVGEFVFNIFTMTNDNWNIFFSWWRGLIDGKTKPNGAIKEKVEELTNGFNGREDKIEALFDFVKQQIRYVSLNLGKSGYEPTSAQEVFENKYGDCKDKSTLLISMLRAAGIPAHYVVIPTHYKGNLIKDIPFPFQFDHCIVAVEQKDGYLFLDPTNKTCRFGYLPAMDQNRDVLIFKEHEVLFAKTPSEEPQTSGTHSTQVIKIDEEGSIEVFENSTYAGDFESYRRGFYLNNSPTEIRERFEERVDGISPGAKLIEYSHSDPLNFKEQFWERFRYHAPYHCQSARDMVTFRIPDIWSYCPESGKMERRYPLDIWDTEYTNHDIEITVPEGYKVYYLPGPIDIQCPFFKFYSSYSEQDEKVLYKQEFIRKASRISPEEYPVYRTFCQEMEKKSKKQSIFFIKKR